MTHFEKLLFYSGDNLEANWFNSLPPLRKTLKRKSLVVTFTAIDALPQMFLNFLNSYYVEHLQLLNCFFQVTRIREALNYAPAMDFTFTNDFVNQRQTKMSRFRV